MKLTHLFSFWLLLAGPMFAQDTFPGLNAILSDAEKKRAGFSRFTPDEIGVIDAALIRYYLRVVTGLSGLPPTRVVATVPPPAPETTAAEKAAAKSRFWEHFGLGKSTTPDWRNQPPMIAKVTAWQGANRFVLDSGQVWEGLEAIPFELPGRDVIIEARPMNAFALKLDENSAVVRVRRVK